MADEHRRADHVRAEPAGDPVHSPFGVTPGDGPLTEGKLGGRPAGRDQPGGANADQTQPRPRVKARRRVKVTGGDIDLPRPTRSLRERARIRTPWVSAR